MPASPQQLRRRDRFESALRLAAPFLDLVLAAGDRFSRIVAPGDSEGYAIQPAGERLGLADVRPPGPRSRPPRQPEA
jgi:hypothetical protein